MSRRQSIELPGARHANPIPAAARIGNLLVSGSILPREPGSERIPDSIEEQCAIIFAQMRQIVEAAGGSTDDIIKVTFWMDDPTKRAAINTEWLRMFPDGHSRPARQTMRAQLNGDYVVQCDFMAVLPDRG